MSVADAAPTGLGRTPLDLPLDRGGTTFIEASAGTGKTHALTTLVARLVVEQDRSLDRILVVTFTRAATAELRDRIRRVLGTTLAAVRARGVAGGGEFALAAGPGIDETIDVDPQARELLAAWERRGGRVDRALARRLETAMRDIDRASIRTIHGFCQRVLVDHAFECGFPFGFEVSGGNGETVARAVRDFWRRRLYPASTLLTRHALDSGFLPEHLTAWVSSRRAKSGVAILGGEPPEDPIEAHEAAWHDAFEAVRVVWDECRDDFLAEVREGSWLNRARYKCRRTERELAAIEMSFAAPELRMPEQGAFGRYGRAQLSQACKRNCTVPGNALFDAFDRLEEACGRFRSACDQWLRWNRRELLAAVHAAVRRSVRDDRRLAYDDLLLELDGALDGAGGKRLAERIRRALPCALIDEYQDTDPVQTRIFGRIYGEVRHGPDAGDGASAREEPGFVDAPAPEQRAGGAVASVQNERPGPFIVVGDPKQSIYRFRGADVFAYLAFRRKAHDRLPLDRNWRSVPTLVDAVNALFAGARPFVTPGIEYRPVSAAPDHAGTLRLPSGEHDAALELWLLPRRQERRLLAKKDVNPAIAGAASDSIVHLLECGERGEAIIDGDPLTGGDIAVLVRTRDQGRLIASALRERGVRSIEIDDGSVFQSREAEQLERLLWVLAEPARESAVRGALAGDLFGLDTRALLTLGDDEDVWSRWIGRMTDWRRHWESKGIGSILLRLLEREDGAKHLLEHPDGARRLTNHRHLAELLQAVETRDRLAPGELATWLNHRRAGTDHHDDAAQLRLESDEQLVKILTVHGSKGLEFPVVYCPFAWDTRGPRPGSDAMYHLGAADDFREVMDLNPDDSAHAAQWIEEFSESVRLLYVAVTRARFRCIVAWGQVYGAEHSPLAWLLHRAVAAPEAEHDGAGSASDTEGQGADGRDASADESEAEAVRAESDGDAPQYGSGAANSASAVTALQNVAGRFKALSASEWLAEVDAFARCHPGAVSVVELDPEPAPIRALTTSETPRPVLAALEPARTLRRIRCLTSFSALAAGIAGSAGDHGLSRAGQADADVDRPDHDQSAEPSPDENELMDANGAEARRERSAFTFPRGPVAGTCLHRIFERLDLPPDPGSEKPPVQEICSAALEEFRIAAEWRSVARAMVERTRALRLREPVPAERGAAPGAHASGATGMESGFRLSDPHPRLVELEFSFPVSGLDRRRLGALLGDHGYPDPFRRHGQSGVAESPPQIEGFLRGFIDLVVEHAGRWYVVDYKSNWLGPGPADYAPPAVAEAMRAGGYALQALIYLVALHRYLATRLPEYEYERHVGGAFYLFVRGIDPSADPQRGAHFARPSAVCLHALDDCFRSGEA